MHRIYCSLDSAADTPTVQLEGEAHHYLSRVIRLGPKDRVILFDESGWEWTAEVIQIDRRSAGLRLLERRPNPCEPEYSVRLVQGYPKGTKFFDLIRAVTALGVVGIDAFTADRSIAGRIEPSDSWQRRANRVALESVRQCGRCRVPEIPPPAPSLDVVLDRYRTPKGAIGFCLWEAAKGPSLAQAADRMPRPDPEKPILLIVGPEGGFTRREVQAAQAAGLPVCHLGPRILRTELASVVALSILQQKLGQME